MSILADKSTRLLIQGMTGNEGKFHAAQMIDYGTNVVAGVTPGRGGQTCLDRPVYDTVAEAVAETLPNASCIFVPAPGAADAALEAMASDIPLVVIITEGMPVMQMTRVYWEARRRGVRLIGPNCPGLITPGQAKIGILPGHICRPGAIGLISRSGTLTYEFVDQLTQGGYGQSTCVGIGGDPIVGTGFVELLEMFEEDEKTEAVVMIGEIGGDHEQKAAAFVKRGMTKPVVGFIAGLTAPPGKQMGHAGAIVSGGSGTATEKIAALEAAGVVICASPTDACEKLRQLGIKPS
jgi:succinyl-CoA synthetase alpha subunit